MNTKIKIFIFTAIAVIALASCDGPEAELRNAKMIDFSFESEAMTVGNSCANGSIGVELLGETQKDDRQIATFAFNCNKTGLVTVNVPVNSYIRITFNNINPVDEFVTSVGEFRTHSEGSVVFKIEE